MGADGRQDRMETLDPLLGEIGDVTAGNLGSLCISQQYRSVAVGVRTDAYETARQKADMLARLLQDLGQLDNPGNYLIFTNSKKRERNERKAKERTR